MPAGFTPVAPLGADHRYDDFDCGTPALNHWLRTWAQHSERVESTKSYVVCREGRRQVVGYHALTAASAGRDDAPKKLVRLAGPHDVPVVLLARLAVDRQHQRQGLGRLLLRDALLRTAQAADHVGAVALMVHAKDDEAPAFYEHYGFLPSPLQPLQLFLPMKTIRSAIRTAVAGIPRAAGA